ncbi:MCE-family protein MCE3A [Mycobacterium simiae]|nr:MCE-family protein MCE3A [Mycobacterium simiae]
MFIVVGALIALTAASFSGKFRDFIPLTLVSDRAGLVMEPGAKVKLRGVPVGTVAAIGTDVKAAKLQLNMDPGPFKYLPSNLEAEIKSTTAFGSKYVDLIVPDQASSTPLRPGAVLHSRNVTVEVNTVFENLQSVVQALDPAKLNSILSAFAQSVRGKGDRLGQAITDANNLLLTVNPRMDTIHRDWRLFGKTTQIYSDAAQDILSALESATTTSATLAENQRSLDALLLSAIGFSQTGINVIGRTEPNIVRAMSLLDPTMTLLNKYSPTYTCLFQGAQWYVDHGGRDALGGNGYSVILDAALLFGDDPYRYPRHLPKTNATGGPGGKPSCGSLPDPSANFPVRALVTDTGWGAAPDEIRTSPWVGNPWWANWFPTTKNPPEPPRYFWRGGQPPP